MCLFHVSVGSCFPSGAGSWLLLPVLLHSCERNQAILTLCRARCLGLSQFDNAVGSQLSLGKREAVSSVCRVLQEGCYILGQPAIWQPQVLGNIRAHTVLIWNLCNRLCPNLVFMMSSFQEHPLHQRNSSNLAGSSLVSVGSFISHWDGSGPAPLVWQTQRSVTW